jgi:hypothetical protein
LFIKIVGQRIGNVADEILVNILGELGQVEGRRLLLLLLLRLLCTLLLLLLRLRTPVAQHVPVPDSVLRVLVVVVEAPRRTDRAAQTSSSSYTVPEADARGTLHGQWTSSV